MSDTEPMDEAAVRRSLGEALRLQARSLVELTLLAGGLTGLAGVGTKGQLREFVQHELEDTYLLTEKLVALGGAASATVETVEVTGDPVEALTALADHEEEAIAALHAVIPHSGQEPRSEALEHLLEHAIMRKQQQVDVLRLAVRGQQGQDGRQDEDEDEDG